MKQIFKLYVSNTLRYNWFGSKAQFQILAGAEPSIRILTSIMRGRLCYSNKYFTLSAGTGNTTVAGGSAGNVYFPFSVVVTTISVINI
jgi:hypothetical protein